jgi:hypothetical protein
MRKNIILLSIIALLMPSLACAFGAIAIDTVKPSEVVKQIVTEVGTKAAVKTIEVDKHSESGYQIVTGQGTDALAKTAAMAGCKEAGHKNCKIVVLFTECGAYASSQTASGSGTGKTKQEAITNAKEGCENCEIVAAACEE